MKKAIILSAFFSFIFTLFVIFVPIEAEGGSGTCYLNAYQTVEKTCFICTERTSNNQCESDCGEEICW